MPRVYSYPLRIKAIMRTVCPDDELGPNSRSAVAIPPPETTVPRAAVAASVSKLPARSTSLGSQVEDDTVQCKCYQCSWVEKSMYCWEEEEEEEEEEECFSVSLYRNTRFSQQDLETVPFEEVTVMPRTCRGTSCKYACFTSSPTVIAMVITDSLPSPDGKLQSFPKDEDKAIHPYMSTSDCDSSLHNRDHRNRAHAVPIRGACLSANDERQRSGQAHDETFPELRLGIKNLLRLIQAITGDSGHGLARSEKLDMVPQVQRVKRGIKATRDHGGQVVTSVAKDVWECKNRHMAERMSAQMPTSSACSPHVWVSHLLTPRLRPSCCRQGLPGLPTLAALHSNQILTVKQWMKPLKPMDTSRVMHVLTGTRLDTNLSSQGHPGWCQCVQLPGSDFAAGTMMMMMTALSQRRRNSHFSGDCEAAVAPSHP
ncbi:hypothetical protein INR49_011771 [Caranx melampygus]|nr:hypothetical protein INR49_011771 [Caranx melampygus]